MKLYLESLLPRLKQYSQDLDRKEIFLDTPWIVIDHDGNKQKYIFRRNGELIMSFNGEVNIGTWEYLSLAKSLLVDRIKDKILLNQYFIHPSIMILTLDGKKQTHMILANENIIPDFNVEGLLKKIYYENNNNRFVMLADGRDLEILNSTNNLELNHSVRIDDKNIEDCIVEVFDKTKKYEIKDSCIIRILTDVEYNTNKGLITIEQQYFGMAWGDRVFINKTPAKTGVYRVSFFDNIYVIDGKVVSKKVFKSNSTK